MFAAIWGFIVDWAAHLLSGSVGGALGVYFNQTIRDWFTGVEKDLRAKANEAAAVVLQAAKTETVKVKAAALDAAAKAVDGAKVAAGVPIAPAPEAAPAPAAQ